MPTIQIPPVLRPAVGGAKSVQAEGGTLGSLLAVCRREAGSPSRAWWYSRKHE